MTTSFKMLEDSEGLDKTAASDGGGLGGWLRSRAESLAGKGIRDIQTAVDTPTNYVRSAMDALGGKGSHAELYKRYNTNSQRSRSIHRQMNQDDMRLQDARLGRTGLNAVLTANNALSGVTNAPGAFSDAMGSNKSYWGALQDRMREATHAKNVGRRLGNINVTNAQAAADTLVPASGGGNTTPAPVAAPAAQSAPSPSGGPGNLIPKPNPVTNSTPGTLDPGATFGPKQTLIPATSISPTISRIDTAAPPTPSSNPFTGKSVGSPFSQTPLGASPDPVASRPTPLGAITPSGAPTPANGIASPTPPATPTLSLGDNTPISLDAGDAPNFDNMKINPTASPKVDWNARFRKSTGTAFDPKSRMDAFNMERLRNGQNTVDYSQYRNMNR